MRRLVFAAAMLVSAARPAPAPADDRPAAERPAAGQGAGQSRLRVAAVQLRSSRNLAANVEAIRRRLSSCARDGVRVAVFPECALTGYFDAPFMKSLTAESLERAERQVADACRAHHIAAVVGTPHRRGDALYNSAVVIDAEGRVIERYHKLHLAEAWPTPGDHLSVFKIEGVPCSIIICHDERYPELVRLPALAGARVVFYVSHESGIKSERKLQPYRAQIQARAVENGVYVIQANAPANDDATGSHGQSRIIGPDGNVLEEASVFGDETVSATLELSAASGKMARLSLDSGPLAEWWRAGVKRVRIIE